MLNSNIEKIKQVINRRNIKIVSFDIFDTLLVRPAIIPEDIFRLVAARHDYEDYTKLRIQAEKSLRKKLIENSGDISLEEIYEEFKPVSQMPGSFVQDLMKTEQSIELEYLVPRMAMKEIYQYVLSKNITVIFSSDMYLPKKTIEQILKKNGYNEYDKIYVSGECQAKKSSGEMYKLILKDYNYISNPNEVLHIGDNYLSDVIQAKKNKLNAIYIKKEIDIFKEHKSLCNIIDNSINSDNSFLIGTCTHYFLEDILRNQIRLNTEMTEYYFVMSLIKFIAPQKEDFYSLSSAHSEDFNLFIEKTMYNDFPSDIIYQNKKYLAKDIIELKKIADNIVLEYFELFKNYYSKLKYNKQAIYDAAIEFFDKNRNGIKQITATLSNINMKSLYNFLYKIAVRTGFKSVLKKACYKVRTLSFKNDSIFKNSAEYFEKISSSVENADINPQKPTILFFGDNADFDKGTCGLINNIYKSTKDDYNFILVNEGYMKKQTEISFLFQCHVITMPKDLAKNFYYPYKEFSSDKAVSEYIKENKYLNESFENLSNKFFDMDKNFAELKVFYADKYIKNVIEKYSPSIVFMWNKFHWQNHLVDNICRQKLIKTAYVEFGVLPGTFCIEQKGQMGESWVAQDDGKFMDVSITEKELEASQSLISHLYASKLNRNSQPANNRKLDLIKNKLKEDRPTILIAGQNDYESGIIPYTNNTRDNHSPVFASSNESATYIAQFAKKNGWNLVYKPHPTIFEKCFKSMPKNLKNIMLVNDVDINDIIDLSDVTITILSQVSYLALIRRKPVVMLGYNQLRGKKCTYEAYSKETIEQSILSALNLGYDKEKKSYFTKHVAQLCKVYLLDNGNDGTNEYIKNLNEGISEVISN